MFLAEFDYLVGSEWHSANWACLLYQSGQAFFARGMAALEHTLDSIVIVVFFETDFAEKTRIVFNRLPLLYFH